MISKLTPLRLAQCNRATSRHCQPPTAGGYATFGISASRLFSPVKVPRVMMIIKIICFHYKSWGHEENA